MKVYYLNWKDAKKLSDDKFFDLTIFDNEDDNIISKITEIVQFFKDNGIYEKMAEITESPLEHVYTICQNGEEQNILKARSMSIGDIIVDSQNRTWLCASCGFERINVVF